jgi:SPP1 gp7 family putative phage head morphogenesis protein
MTDDLARRTSQTLIEGVVRGRRARAIAGDLAEDLGISQRRARLIARNETATLNGTLNRVRQQQAGVKRYVWSTSLDERVRPLHQEREGRTYSWDDPPSDGHPGEPINCRCVARAVIGSTLSRDSLTRDAFEEAKHPRGAHGRFGEKPDQSSTHVPWWLGQRKAKREWAQTDPKTFSTAFGDRELRIKQYGSSSWSVSLDGNRIGDIPKATRAKAMLTALQMAEDHVAAQHAPTPKPKLTKSQREEKARQVAASPVPDKEAVAELYDYLNVPSVNGSLRMGKALTDEERDQVAGLDRLMMPIGEGKTLWRWVHARHDDARVVNKLRDGQAVQDLAYVSTSKMSEADFLGQFVPAQEGETWLETAYVMEIKGHPGLRGIDANQVLPDHRFASQREILLERGLVLERIAERKAIIGNGKTVRVITFRTSSRGTKIADASFSATDAAFEEAKHPRGAHGRFGEKPDAGQWWLGQRKPAITRIRELEAEGRLKFALYADEKRTMADLIGDRVSPDSFLKMMGAPTGEVHVPTERAGFLKLRHENDAYNWERTFDVRSRVVTHDVFRVNNQGAGTAKRVLRDQVALYRELGVKRIELDAVSLGSYAWAKYGFRPDEASWRAMRPQIRNRLSEVSDEVRPLVEKVVESQDPRAVWALSDLPGKLGLSLLRDLPWSGSLDLSDEMAMRRFHDYVSR